MFYVRKTVINKNKYWKLVDKTLRIRYHYNYGCNEPFLKWRHTQEAEEAPLLRV